jgi:Sulfotransferase family
MPTDPSAAASQAPSPSARDPWKVAPIFVLAPARSYTSVISMMLGQHPALVGLPELKLFAYPTIGDLEASLPGYWGERGVTHRSPGLIRALAEFLFGDQTLASLALARTWLRERSHWSGADVLDILMERLQPRICVEKSPENVETSAALARVSAAYPQARYLHLTRHPVATQRSIQEHLDRILPGYGQDGQPTSGIAAWFATHRRILAFAATLSTDRYMRVRAEDVLNDMRHQLGSIAAWLGLRSDAAAVEAMVHPEASPFARLGPAGSGLSGGNDPAFLRNPIPHGVEVPGPVAPPPGWSEKASVWQMVVDLANELGYS